jgi:chromosomal replication initiation ATPase DnaA
VRYISTEEFTNDFINSLRDDRKVAFQRRYRDVDVLLVDDIQFLEGKEGTQEEFFVRVGADHRHPAARAGDSDRHPAQEGRPGPAGRAGRGAGVHRGPDRAQHP